MLLPRKRKPPDIDGTQIVTRTAVAASIKTAAATAVTGVAFAAAARAAAAAVIGMAVAAAARAAAAAAVTSTSTAMSALKPDIGRTSTLGNRMNMRAHASGVSTLLQVAPSPVSFVRPALLLRPPMRWATPGRHRGEHQQTCPNPQRVPTASTRKHQQNAAAAAFSDQQADLSQGHPGRTSWA